MGNWLRFAGMAFLFGGYIILLVGYLGLFIFFHKKWKQVPNAPQTIGESSRIRFSIVIPARNEEANIGALLHAIQTLDYDPQLFEVLVADDHSTDNTAAIVRSFPNVKLIEPGTSANNAHKKNALTACITAAKNDWILTTDADCLPQPGWLKALSAIITKEDPLMVIAPVAMVSDGSALSSFQSIDFLTMQGITAGMVHGQNLNMANGANLAYTKMVFEEVGGFSGIDHIASGDDMLLLEKIRKTHPERISYLKAAEAIVKTKSMPDWKSFLQQRIRWASKATYYRDPKIFGILFFVYLFNLCFPFFVIDGFWYAPVWWLAAATWLLKTIIEWPFVLSVHQFFNQKISFLQFFLFQPLHILYILLSGFLGQTGSYTWKGRMVRVF